MTLLAIDRERLWALYRRLDELDCVLARIRRRAATDEPSICHSFSGLGVLDDAVTLCATHRRRIRMVLESEFFHQPAARSSSLRLQSWIDTHPSWWAKATHGESTDIDLILRAVRDDPVAAGVLADRADFVAPLLYGARDTDAVRAFWLMVTDPAVTAPDVAGRRIRALLATVFGDHPWSDGPSRTSIDPVERRRIETAVRDMLGAIVAPWQFAFSGRVDQWSWSSEEGISWLRRIAESTQAAADLSRGLGPAVVESLSHLPDESGERRRLIDEVAVGIGASLQVLEEAGLDDAGRDTFSWHAVDQLVDLVPLNTPWPVSILVDRGASWLDARLTERSPRTDHLATLTGHQVLAGLAVLTVWRSYWTQSNRVRSPEERDRELRHTYDAIDAPSTRGRVIASRP